MSFLSYTVYISYWLRGGQREAERANRDKKKKMNVEFLFSEVMKHSARSRVEKWKISTFLLLM